MLLFLSPWMATLSRAWAALPDGDGDSRAEDEEGEEGEEGARLAPVTALDDAPLDAGARRARAKARGDAGAGAEGEAMEQDPSPSDLARPTGRVVGVIKRNWRT